MSEHYLKVELDELVRSDPAIFQFLQAGSLDGIWYWDLENPEHEWLSPQMWRVLGHSPEGKAHDPAAWQDLIDPQDLERALANFNAHCADPSHPYDQVVRYTAADGSSRWVRCRGIAIRDADGTPTRMLGAHNDLTTLKRTEAELQAHVGELEETRIELEEANALLRNFVRLAAHDLREPARSVLSFSDLLAMRYGDDLPERAQDLIAHIQNGADRMTRLVDGLQELSRLSTTDEPFVHVDLGPLVGRVVDGVTPDLQAVDGVLEVGPLPTVRGRPNQLLVVFENLVANAIKFRSPDRPLRISIHAEGGLLHVEDNGIGLPAEAGERVFQMFKRYHSRSEFAGDGIGLGLCSRVVRLHGGSIDYVPTPGGGTTFRVQLQET